ncbi:DUF4352 domain-containing protein [uncultured Microbacterium sp.]|uniref:DUF4352 domain-containing protein n=1 Tax=uncultured Microbacterium sp. TaxID=191216 RepID=UPI0025FF7FFC|nr:DUF4352 domain-containing protein [uncultured Microbacterium sp.]
MKTAARGGAAIAALSVLFLAGCSAPADPAPTVTVTVTATPAAAAPSPTASAAAASALPLGEAKAFPDVTVTAHEFRPDSTPEPAPQPQTAGDRWASLDVEVCNTSSEQFTVSGNPWSLVAADNRTYSESSTGYDQFPQPRFAFGDQAVEAGMCRRGWITFVVNGDATINSIRYANTSGNIVRWTP